MNPNSHLRQQHSTEQQQEQQVQTAKKFESVEEVLRHDAATISPPPIIAERLKASLASEPRAKRPWWKRLIS